MVTIVQQEREIHRSAIDDGVHAGAEKDTQDDGNDDHPTGGITEEEEEQHDASKNKEKNDRGACSTASLPLELQVKILSMVPSLGVLDCLRMSCVCSTWNAMLIRRRFDAAAPLAGALAEPWLFSISQRAVAAADPYSSMQIYHHALIASGFVSLAASPSPAWRRGPSLRLPPPSARVISACCAGPLLVLLLRNLNPWTDMRVAVMNPLINRASKTLPTMLLPWTKYSSTSPVVGAGFYQSTRTYYITFQMSGRLQFYDSAAGTWSWINSWISDVPEGLIVKSLRVIGKFMYGFTRLNDIIAIFDMERKKWRRLRAPPFPVHSTPGYDPAESALFCHRGRLIRVSIMPPPMVYNGWHTMTTYSAQPEAFQFGVWKLQGWTWTLLSRSPPSLCNFSGCLINFCKVGSFVCLGRMAAYDLAQDRWLALTNYDSSDCCPAMQCFSFEPSLSLLP